LHRKRPLYCVNEEELVRRAPIAALQRYVRARLHRRLFLWFGASIAMTAATVVVVLSLFFPADRDGPREQYQRFQTFVGHRFAEVWGDGARREALGAAVAEELDVGVRLLDANGVVLGEHGAYACEEPHFQAAVESPSGGALGTVAFCGRRPVRPWGLVALAMLVAGGTLWAAAGMIARRIAKPLGQVAGVAREIGDGNLDARVRLEDRHRVGEIRVLGDSLNEMASRIQKQLEDQRELLAAVSHELRTPLGHLRILLEMTRDAGTDPKLVDELEREILEVDDLVGELLASSRLSFDTLAVRPVEGLDLGARALERAGLPLELLASEDDSVAFSGDPTLIGRALANLLENARRYGGGVERLEVTQRPTTERGKEVVFSVLDRGQGFAPEDLERVFDPFYRGERRAGATHASLGLGLSLVSRIAQAHGGRAWAENREGGGARVSFSVVVPPGLEPANRDPLARSAA
jgi:signal transduction histidine kinase